MNHMYRRLIVGTDSSASQPAEKGHGRSTKGAERNLGNRGGECSCSLQATCSIPKEALLL